MPQKIVTEEMRQEMIERYRTGETVEGIWKTMSISPMIVARTLETSGVILRNKGHHVLTPQQEEEVIKKYNNGQSMSELAKEYHCSTEPIKRVTKKARMQGRMSRKPMGELLQAAINDTSAILIDYQNGMSSHAIHKKYGHHYGYVRSIIKKANIAMRDDRDRQGPDAPQYRGGRHLNAQGYVKVWIPKNSPYISMRTMRGHVFEHRLVMAQHLGRPLFPYETVHHRNGNKQDNRIENLEHWERSHGEGQRVGENPVPHCPTCTCKNH